MVFPRKITIEDLTPEFVATKPKNAPLAEKWLKNNGKISVDENGFWIYTNANNQSVKYVNGYLDFKSAGFVEQEVDIGSFKNRWADFTKADALLPDVPLEHSLYTWHHVEDGQTLQGVNKEIHRIFTHRGGIALIKNKERKK